MNIEAILAECKRQWHENQEKEGLGKWEDQSDDTQLEYYEQIKENMKDFEESSPTDLTSEDKEFDYDNPPLTCEEIPDSVIPAEALKKLVEARKLIIEAKNMLGGRSSAESFAFKLANSSPYAQIQWLYMTDEMQDSLKSINTLLHINDTGECGIKSALDEEAHKEGILVKDYARKLLHMHTLNMLLGL